VPVFKGIKASIVILFYITLNNVHAWTPIVLNECNSPCWDVFMTVCDSNRTISCGYPLTGDSGALEFSMFLKADYSDTIFFGFYDIRFKISALSFKPNIYFLFVEQRTFPYSSGFLDTIRINEYSEKEKIDFSIAANSNKIILKIIKEPPYSKNTEYIIDSLSFNGDFAVFFGNNFGGFNIFYLSIAHEAMDEIKVSPIRITALPSAILLNGLRHNNKKYLSIYADLKNSGLVNIVVDDSDIDELFLFDSMGKLIWHFSDLEKNTNLHVYANLLPGVYYCKAKIGCMEINKKLLIL
jgi:hypothetical protein